MTKNRKLVLSLLFIFSFVVSSTFSLGAGVQVGVNPSLAVNQDGVSSDNFEGNITGTIRLFRIPAVFGFGLEAGIQSSDFIFGASGFFDYWFVDYQIKNTWNLYSGAGISGSFMLDFDKYKAFTLGPRFFVGMNWLFLDNYVEYYAQINLVPTYVRPLNADQGSFRLSVPVETGVRLHF